MIYGVLLRFVISAVCLFVYFMVLSFAGKKYHRPVLLYVSFLLYVISWLIPWQESQSVALTTGVIRLLGFCGIILGGKDYLLAKSQKRGRYANSTVLKT